MALKAQHRAKHLTPSKQMHADPWSFLELIDGPQWIDLSSEECLMEKEGDDPWFDRVHKNHVISLAGLNSKMSWLRLGKAASQANQVKPCAVPSRGCQKIVPKFKDKEFRGQLPKSDSGQQRYQSQVKDIQVQKEAWHSKSTSRCGNTGGSLSDSSTTSECEPSISIKKYSSGSDRSSVTSSSLLAFSVESNKFSSNLPRGSLSSSQFYHTPTYRNGGGYRSRSSSSASNCPPMPRVRHSSELGAPGSTDSQPTFRVDCQSSEDQLSSGDSSRFISSGDSVLTVASMGAPSTSEEQVGEGCARILKEAWNGITNVDEEVEGHPSCGSLALDSARDYSICQDPARRVVTYRANARERRLETRVSQAGSLSRKQLSPGKENAPPRLESGCLQAGKLQTQDKSFQIVAPLGIASSRMANAKLKAVDSLGVGCQGLQFKLKDGQAVSSKGVIALKGGRTSLVAQQKKRTEVFFDGFASDKTKKSEEDLAALVAQHNKKIRALGLQQRRKGIR